MKSQIRYFGLMPDLAVHKLKVHRIVADNYGSEPVTGPIIDQIKSIANNV